MHDEVSMVENIMLKQMRFTTEKLHFSWIPGRKRMFYNMRSIFILPLFFTLILSVSIPEQKGSKNHTDKISRINYTHIQFNEDAESTAWGIWSNGMKEWKIKDLYIYEFIIDKN